MIRRPPRSTLFPYTTLFRSRVQEIAELRLIPIERDVIYRGPGLELSLRQGQMLRVADQIILYTLAAYLPARRPVTFGVSSGRGSDRKSTRLNSSHSQISYAV